MSINKKLDTIMKIETVMRDVYGSDVIYTINWTPGKIYKNSIEIDVISKTLNDSKTFDDDYELTHEEIDEIIKYFEEFLPEIDLSVDEKANEQNVSNDDDNLTPAERQKKAFKRAMSIVGLKD